jgi:iron complex transport system substrate-binding protein
MSGDNNTPTRRETIKYGGAVVSTGLFAGCTAESESGSPPTETNTNGEPENDGSYTVSMAPAGDVTFNDVPESWMTYFSTYGDMGIALGQLDGLEAAIFAENWPMQFFEYLPGVDISLDGVEQVWADGGIPKETFYEVDADVHVMDPNFIFQLDDSWDDADLTEVRTEIGPIIGNWIRRRNFDWHDYEYYSLYEAFEKVAEVFQQQERYNALKSVHDEFIDDLQSELPPQSERPEIGLMSVNDDFEAGVFSLYQVTEGNGKKQYQDLGINDAFGDLDSSNTNDVDYELLLDIDPDILVFHFASSHVTEETVEEKREVLRNNELGSQLSAVQNDRMYPGGTAYQGPIINLFQTSMAAKQFYPEIFGEWNGYETFADESNWLFDHQRVADIINGNF